MPDISLTPREKEVLTLVFEGISSKAIGAKLFITKRTVDFHLRNIFHKLSVNNRLAAVRAAHHAGLLRWPESKEAPR